MVCGFESINDFRCMSPTSDGRFANAETQVEDGWASESDFVPDTAISDWRKAEGQEIMDCESLVSER